MIGRLFGFLFFLAGIILFYYQTPSKTICYFKTGTYGLSCLKPANPGVSGGQLRSAP